ncbi:hypothetical protein JW707_04300 [Candidatus Woesearchaeota archaeon]|nr:hypothetical protein [Candidatus Woesearchaeota archaeon]
MKKAMILVILALLALSVFGCTPKTTAPAGEETELTADIAGIDELDADLDMSELESLDSEFAELESLFS